MKRVTIYDVAKEAGVSLATVSRVINGSNVVKGPTRDKVQEAVDKLGYKPNAIAQGLALQKTTTIGLVVPEASFTYTGQIINGLIDVAKIYNYNIMAVLCGCAKKTDDSATLDEYQTYYNAVAENVSFTSTSKNFNCELEMTQVEDGTYRYYIVMDQPVSAMYDIVAIVVENDVAYNDAEKMMPSIGIFDDTKSMIPNQVDTANGFVKGIALSGESSTSTIKLKMLVQWMDKAKKNSTREFLSYTLSADKNS